MSKKAILSLSFSGTDEGQKITEEETMAVRDQEGIEAELWDLVGLKKDRNNAGMVQFR